MAEDDAGVTIAWSSVEDMAVQPVNVLLVQAGSDNHILNLGFMAPPLPGEQAADLSVRTVARVMLTPDTADMLITALTDNVREREELQRKQGAGDDD